MESGVQIEPHEAVCAPKPVQQPHPPKAYAAYLRTYRALGIARVIVLFPYGREWEMLGLLTEEVLPAFTTARA